MVVACSRNIDENGDWKNPINDLYYELFGEKFDSKKEAIDYFLYNKESGVKSQKYQDIYNQLILGENKFETFEEVFDYIENSYEIKETKTNKNVDDYVMDSLGQLYPEVLADSNDETIVYKDANGKAISESNEQIAKEAVEKSYLDKIEKVYYSNGKEYENKSDLEEDYYSNFLNNNSLPSKDLYNYGNLAYTKEGLKQQIENSLELEYTTKSGDKFLDSQVNDLSVINPTEVDKAKIDKIYNSPGLYHLEQIDEKDGVYTGDSIIESTSDIQNIILNKNNWELVSSETGSAKEALFNLISSTIVYLVEQLMFLVTMNVNSIVDLGILENRFGSLENFTVNTVFDGFKAETELSDFKYLIKKYGLIGESNAAVNSLKNIKSMDFSTLCSIYLYQMKEAFRFTNITQEDNLMLSKIYYNFFLKFDTRKEWKDFVEKIGIEDATYITDFLVNKKEFSKFNNSRKDSNEIKNILNHLADKSLDFAESKFNDLVSDIQKKVAQNNGVFERYVTKVLDLSVKAQKALIITSIVIEILDFIPISSTKTYQLLIPDTHQRLEYQMTNFILSSKKFDPSKIFRVTQLKKPIKNDIYLYQERYFPTYDDAIIQLKRDIINETLMNGKKVYFSSKDKNYKNENKDDLVNILLEEYLISGKIGERYTDFFGGRFDNEQMALQSMLEKLEKEEYQIFYKYSFEQNEYRYFTNFEEAKEYVLSTFTYTSKKVLFSELVQGKNNYDELYNLDFEETTIYYFDFYGIKYYFKDKTNLMYYIMKLLNFRNNLIEIEVEQFWLNDKFFSNRAEYIDYLYSNIKEIDNSNTRGIN